MIKEYHEIQYPARDIRASIPQDERIAEVAAMIINGESDYIYHAEKQHGQAPQPPRSARINARHKISHSETIVEIRGTREWFLAIEKWLARLDAANYPSS